MHAPVLQVEVEQTAHRPGHAGAAAQVQRVEHADVDVRVRGEGGHLVVDAVAGGVIEQDANPHTAVGSLQQLVDQGAGTETVVDDVVLQVDARLGVANQLGPRAKRFIAVGQQAKTRASFVGGGLALH
ncbi:hypothetical protein D3C81_1189450 [compost metagenome]